MREELFMERREQFKRWLQNERMKKSGNPIPEKTIECYLRNVHKISDVMYESGVISKRLYSMRSVEEVNDAIKSISKDRTYLTMNTKSENTCDKALRYYAAFTQALYQEQEE